MKAIIFAAGLGTRLQHLSKDTPKAMIQLQGKPLIHIAIEKLTTAGFDDIIINVHHFSDQIKAFVNHTFPTDNIRFSDEKDELLETGGGLVKAKKFFNDGNAFLAYNVDVLSDIDLSKMYQTHIDSGAMATLAIRKRTSSRYLLFDEDFNMNGWTKPADNNIIHSRTSKAYHPFAFSGIHIISPEIFEHIQQKGKFSLTPAYLELSKKHHIKGYLHDQDYWFDLGSPEKLEQASSYLNQQHISI